ncbi:DNA repair-scaffolding protein [Aulostomus maculatus]
MSSRKRKKYSEAMKCVLFPDDTENYVKAVKGPSSVSLLSSAKSWEKCGDSFLESPMTKNLKPSRRKLSAVRKLAVSHASDAYNEDPVHIAWSSSDSGKSDEDTRDQHVSKVVAQQQQGPQTTRRPTTVVQSHVKTLCMHGSDKDDLPVIGTDSDLEDSEEGVQKDSGQQISDCESASSDENPDVLPPKPKSLSELEISGYVSDGENSGDTMTLSRLDSQRFPLQTREGSKRSVSDWVRSAHSILQTPQKPYERQSKTPEDSAKKKRKFQSGGLAMRLNRLQCRQRSAMSFWRHQSASDPSATTPVDRPGVLVLKVLEVQEECSMQLAHCEHHQSSGEGHQQSHPLSGETARLLVLFNRETAAQLSPAPADIIHIYPPWQSLTVESFSCKIILNTHFSQKVYSASQPANMAIPRGLLSAERLTPYSLCRIFGMLEVCGSTEQNNAKQVAVPDGLCSSGGSGILAKHGFSLLEAIEGRGQAGLVGQDVVVVVQRVYSIPVPDWSLVSMLKAPVPSRPPSAPPAAEKVKTRLCVLVQDSYGMFSVVQLHLLPYKDDLHQYCQVWQGKSCVLRGIKVVQRVTRERRTRLFSLIDSVWPPVIPLRYHGNTPSPSSSLPSGAALSFCYLLSGHESSVEPSEAQTVSALYLPPTQKNLRDILQTELKIFRCSFLATVVFKRMQSSDVGQGEVWLVLTDPSLQDESSERPRMRTVALCVNASCVLTSLVFKALNSPAACRMSFRDAIKEHGVLLCVEDSVIEICTDVKAEGGLNSPARPRSQSLNEPTPKPVRLDPLGPEITPNSLCTLTGVIVGVDENAAYSWPACNHCGSDSLEKPAHRPQNFYCGSCRSTVDKPATKIQMEVFLSCDSLHDCTIKVKLLQKTIMSILDTTELEYNEFPGYDVERVLGKEVGPLTVYVRVVTWKPAFWIGLEEVNL